MSVFTLRIQVEGVAFYANSFTKRERESLNEHTTTSFVLKLSVHTNVLIGKLIYKPLKMGWHKY